MQTGHSIRGGDYVPNRTSHLAFEVSGQVRGGIGDEDLSQILEEEIKTDCLAQEEDDCHSVWTSVRGCLTFPWVKTLVSPDIVCGIRSPLQVASMLQPIEE